MESPSVRQHPQPNEPPLAVEVIDGCFDRCPEVIYWLRNREWQRSTTFDGVLPGRDSDTTFFPMLGFDNPLAVHDMNRAVWSAMDAYARKWQFRFALIEDVSVQHYEIGRKYDVHVDAGVGLPRVMSAVLYLNTVDVGGVTYFPHFDFGVQPVEGRLVIFPSNYVYAHEAQPPVSGEKYAAAYWARQ